MRGMLEFQERYGSEAGCIETLARLRWPQGYVCARLRRAAELPTQDPAADLRTRAAAECAPLR